MISVYILAGVVLLVGSLKLFALIARPREVNRVSDKWLDENIGRGKY